MPAPLELFLIDARSGDNLVVLGRHGTHTVIGHMPVDASLKALGDIGRRIGKSLTGDDNRLSNSELKAFGAKLFSTLFQDDLRSLYDRLESGRISVEILSDRSEIREVPWEYLATPDRIPVPHRDRSIVRVLPTCDSNCDITPRKLGKLRVLFVAAEPIDQPGVSWRDVESYVDRAVRSQLPGRVELKVVPGATRQGLMQAIAQETFDIFHFYGHGELVKEAGHLLLEDVATHASDRISGEELATALAGKGARLAILSACVTGAGNHHDDFSVMAAGLVKSGIAAVVANQYPIPIKSVAPFVGSLYASLLQDGNIDYAVAEGRAMLAVGISGATNASVEWGVPTLYRRTGVRQILDVA